MWSLLLVGLALAQDPALEHRLLGPQMPAVGPAAPVAGPVAPEGDAPLQTPATTPEAVLPAAEATGDATAGLDWLDSLQAEGAVGSDTPSPGVPWWVPMVALIGAGGVYWTRRKAASQDPVDAPAIRVVSKAALGGTAGVAIVEVMDGNRRRRLVVGTGDKQPVLLTELSDVRADGRRASPLPDNGIETRDDFEVDTLRPVSRRSSGLSKALSKPARKAGPARTAAQDWMAADPSSELGPRKAAARVLINQEMNRRAGP